MYFLSEQSLFECSQKVKGTVNVNSNDTSLKEWYVSRQCCWNLCLIKYELDIRFVLTNEIYLGNWVLWKRHNAEMPQKKRKPLKTRSFRGVSAISVRKTEIPQTPVFEGFPLYFEVFSKIFEGFPLFSWQLFLRNFPIFLRDFPIFLRRFRKIFEAFPYF